MCSTIYSIVQAIDSGSGKKADNAHPRDFIGNDYVVVSLSKYSDFGLANSSKIASMIICRCT